MSRKKSTENELPSQKFDIKLGPITTKKLQDSGAKTVMDLLIMGAEEISIKTGMKMEDCYDIEQKCIDRLTELGKLPKLSNWKEQKDYQKSVTHIPTNCAPLDEMLRGGVETKSITEVYGPEGAGKTQFVMAAAVEALKQGFGVYVIDCENTFDYERFEEIAKHHDLELTDEVMSKFELEVTPDTYTIIRAIDRLASKVEEKNIKLVLVDGLVGKFRMEYDQGRGVLNDRQNKIKSPIRHLWGIAFYLDCAVVCTNQVMDNPDGAYTGEPTKPIGGHILGHTAKYIIRFNKGAKNKRIGKFIKSNKDIQREVEFYLTEEGVSETPEMVKMPKFKEGEAKDTSLLLES